jgi:hypothetical protein
MKRWCVANARVFVGPIDLMTPLTLEYGNFLAENRVAYDYKLNRSFRWGLNRISDL